MPSKGVIGISSNEGDFKTLGVVRWWVLGSLV